MVATDEERYSSCCQNCCRNADESSKLADAIEEFIVNTLWDISLSSVLVQCVITSQPAWQKRDAQNRRVYIVNALRDISFSSVPVQCVITSQPACRFYFLWCCHSCVGPVGHNHIYTVYIQYFWHGNHQIYTVYIRFWPTLFLCDMHKCHLTGIGSLFAGAQVAFTRHLVADLL
jgi:hypothetical protein